MFLDASGREMFTYDQTMDLEVAVENKKRRVLVVDDEQGITDALRLNLEGSGKFEVRTETDSRNVLQVAREFKPDIMLLDVVMPGLDGGDVKSQIRSDPDLKDLPIIMVTALVSNQEMSEEGIIQSGDDVMLAKPVKVDKLIACIDQMLSGGL